MNKKIVVLIAVLCVCAIMLFACTASKESAEMTAKWTALDTGIPKMLESLQSRVDILSQSKKLPASISAEAFTQVKSALASAKDEWTKAKETYKTGKVADAIKMGTSVKEKLVKAMETLGMTVPAGMK